MNVVPFIIAAYSVAAAGIGGMLVISLIAMRRAEKALDELRQGR